MIFGGFNKNTLIDFPSKIGCIVFTLGCNLHCPYCHNPELIKKSAGMQIPKTEIIDFLNKRKGLIEGVVISGGEPTLHKGLLNFCEQIKEMGFAVKLDTNGTNPDILENLINKKCIDYIAMDIKTDIKNYFPLISKTNYYDALLSSISLIMNSDIEYEFRTTCVKPFINEDIIKKIALQIKGANNYFLQKCRPEKMLNPDFFNDQEFDFTDKQLDILKSIAEPFILKCNIR